MDKIKISVVCNTYNHELYIEKTIQSFLNQIGDFEMEVLIYDDASTDKTREIIEKFQHLYPQIIYPEFVEENQYSKGINVLLANIERATGKYIAICEGDDYWIDSHKLEKQIAILEENPSYSACVHASEMIDATTNKHITFIRAKNENSFLSLEEIILQGGSYFSTNTILFKVNNNSEIRPDFFYRNPYQFSDYQLNILLALLGDVYYLNEVMSVYRYNVPGSWTVRNMKVTEKKVRHLNEIFNVLDQVDSFTNSIHHELIEYKKLLSEFYMLIDTRKISETRKDKYRKVWVSLSNQKKISIWIRYYFPGFHSFIFSLKEYLAHERK